MNLIKEKSSSSFPENQLTILLNPDNAFGIHSLTPKDFIVEYQNQMRLSRQGLEFIFDLYKNAANSNTRVSIIICMSFQVFPNYV